MTTPPDPAQTGSFAWSAEFELGHAATDADHALLFDVVNRLAQAIASHATWEHAAALAGELVAETRRHFASEEAAMARHAYPQLDLHREQHVELLSEIERLRQRLAEEHYLAQPQKALRFLRDWFAIHIARSDRDFVDFLKTLPES